MWYKYTMININQEEAQVIRALARLGLAEGKHQREFIERQVSATKEKLVTATDMVLIHRLQGKAEAYQDLLKAVDDALTIENGR